MKINKKCYLFLFIYFFCESSENNKIIIQQPAARPLYAKGYQQPPNPFLKKPLSSDESFSSGVCNKISLQCYVWCFFGTCCVRSTHGSFV